MLAVFNAFRRPMNPAALPDPMFEVKLVSASPYGAPLKLFTTQPLKIAGELLRDRDPLLWDVEIRALARNERPV